MTTLRHSGTALRQRMIEDLQLRGLAPKTQEAYVGAVRQLAKHYEKAPDQISEEELRQYFLHLKNEKQVSRSTCTIALCGIKFFYEKTLGRDWTRLDFVRPAREKKLPVVLSSEEVGRVLGCVRRFRYRVCLSTIYGCGLRLGEGVRLQVSDIDGERMVVHVRQGKGGKPLCAVAEANLGAVARTVVESSPSAVAVSRPTTSWSGCVYGTRADECKRCSESVQGGVARERHSETGDCAYFASFVCHASVGSRGQLAYHPSLFGS